MSQPRIGEAATARLLFRPPRLSDTPALFAFMGDPVAMQHTHCQPGLRACRRHIAGHEWQRRRTGIAPWTILERESGRIVGWGGLYDDPFDPGWGNELAYFFAPGVWGRGYASELAALSVRMARDVLGLTHLHAFAHRGNPASRRVLEKAGFMVQRYLPEMERDLYRHGLGG